MYWLCNHVAALFTGTVEDAGVAASASSPKGTGEKRDRGKGEQPSFPCADRNVQEGDGDVQAGESSDGKRRRSCPYIFLLPLTSGTWTFEIKEMATVRHA